MISVIYTIKTRLRNAFPFLSFGLMPTIGHSIFPGNVGTAYRQRTQIQVFLFVLIGVGWTVYRERRENKRIINADVQKRVNDHLRTRALYQEVNQ